MLRLILPKFDGPSPRSSLSNAGRLLAPELEPPNQDEDVGGVGPADQNDRGASQSYSPCGWTKGLCCCWLLRFIHWLPSHPRAAPLQNPGRHPTASAAPVELDEGYLVYGGGASWWSGCGPPPPPLPPPENQLDPGVRGGGRELGRELVLDREPRQDLRAL